MCDSWKLERGDEMTPEEVHEVFRKIGDLDVVRLSGGEPFLRTDMLDLAETVMAASHPAVLHITTNGSFPDRIERLARSFSQPRRLRFMVSFDGLGITHDENRGKRVTFDRAMDTVRRLTRVRDDRSIQVSINHTVISNRSLTENTALRALMTEIGVDVHSVLAYSNSAMYGASRRGTRASDLIVLQDYPLHEALDRNACVAFVESELEGLDHIHDRATRWGKRYYLHGLKARLERHPNPKPKPKCTALRSHIRLLPDGSVPVCQFNTETVGNLRESSFDDVWRKASRDARSWVDQCEGCWAECEVVPSALYSGDILRPRPYA